jgi:VirB8 protein
MDRDASFHDAKRLYLESYGDPMVTNTYLKIALVLLSLITVVLALVHLRTIRTFENFRPLVIRIDDLGRAEAVNYHNFEYKPQDAETKYFLSQFTSLFYRRNRYTIQNDFAKSLYFLDGKLANGILDNAGVVAGVHLAASAQPPRATSLPTSRFACSQPPRPIPPFAVTRTNGARQESLGCCGLPPAPPARYFTGTKESRLPEGPR